MKTIWLIYLCKERCYLKGDSHSFIFDEIGNKPKDKFFITHFIDTKNEDTLENSKKLMESLAYWDYTR